MNTNTYEGTTACYKLTRAFKSNKHWHNLKAKKFQLKID